MRSTPKQRICEMCGNEAPVFLTEVDGVELYLCSKCSKFGKPVRKKSSVQSKYVRKSFVKPQKKVVPKKPIRVEKEFFHNKILVENYGQLIQKKRKELGIPRAKFAAMIKEKETLLARIEAERVVPTDKVVQKIERELGIELRTEFFEEPTAVDDVIPQTTTIGSIAKIKKRKKDKK